MPITQHPGICRNCHGGCAVTLHVQGGRLLRVTPRKDSPFNCGRMCIKGVATPELVHHPDRLRSPLRRIGPRGSGVYEPISWDEALDETAARLTALRAAHGPEALAVAQGTGRYYYLHVMRFANSFGTPNWFEPGLANCFIPRITVSNLTYGGFVTGDYYGDIPPRTILFWGHNPLVSGPDGELSFPVERALAQGAYGIAVDPRRSETARRCQLWLPIHPGTDAALALAMCREIIEANIYDADFVAQWTQGFDALRERVAPCTLAWAERTCGVPAADIRAAAHRYATAKPGILDWGVALEQTPHTLQTVRAIACLRGLTGNLDTPGADILGLRLIKPYPVRKQDLPEGALDKRLGAKQFRLLGGFHAFMPSAHIPAVVSAMETGEPYPVRGMLMIGTNPLTTIANPRRLRQAMLGLDTIISVELFMTPSAALADIILPGAMWPEIDQLVELPFVAGNAVFAQRRALQIPDCRQVEQILIDLARRLDLPGAEEELECLFDQQLAPTGLSFEALARQFALRPPFLYEKYKEKGFRTRSRKVEFSCQTLARLGYDPLPFPAEPPESPASRPDLAAGFPYRLITGARRREFFCSEQRQSPLLRGRRPHPQAELHPEIASREGIADGDWIEVCSPRGTARFKAKVTPDIRSDVVSVDHGWWFPERTEPDRGVFESNANCLTSDAPPYDPAFGSYQLRGLLCAVRPAKNTPAAP
ncbi:molybdopterin-containing oxidoreductase family protein [Megalodesulfovibrio paquesii]